VHVHAPGLDAPLLLQSGDIAVMARGCEHVLAVGPSLAGLPISTIGAPPAPVAAGEAGHSAVISGAYQLWNTPVHPFFREIPAWFVVRADELPAQGPLALTLRLLQDEVRQQALGADTVTHALLDVVFTYLLRETVARQAPDAAGWAHAVRDPQVREVVAHMHRAPAQPWTLDELARAAGLSRTGLAERFRDAMGDTPLSYLRTVRLQQAMRWLSESDRTLEQVAQEVGYQDAFSFSKAFKREVGVSPREFRRRDAADKPLAYRF
jgi:AraC-like DNA-binding protein